MKKEESQNIPRKMMALSEDEDFELRPFDGKILRRVLGYLKPYRWPIIKMACASLAGLACSLTLPILLKIGIDRYIMIHNMKGLNRLAIFFIVVAIAQYFALRYQGMAITKIGQHAIFDLRQDLFEHIQKLSISFFDRQKAGRIMLRVTNDINSLEELMTSGVSIAFADTVTLVGILFVMFWLDWRMSLVVFLTLPLTVWVAFFLRSRLLDVSRRMRRKLSTLNAFLNESLMGIRVTQAFAREKVNAGFFQVVNQEYYQAGMKFVPLNAFFWPWTGFLNVVGTMLVLLAGGILTVYGLATLGTIAAFMNYITRFFQPIQNLSNLFNNISNAMASCERIFELRDVGPEVEDPESPRRLEAVEGSVAFMRVDFAYRPGALILKNFNLEVKPGEHIAIVGPTGAGKTTIINLVCRFYDPVAGQVLVDGISLKDVAQAEYRKQIAVVLQDSFTFTGTIAENIRYGKPEADSFEIEAAAKAVGIHDFIMTLPQRYDTMIQERASNFSMGQRQLIAFARALLRDPRILILDEATSSIDTQTEQALQEALQTLLKGRTAFIIAHRLSTIRTADRIIVIQDGSLVEMGRHQELIKKDGVYASLYEKQYRAG